MTLEQIRQREKLAYIDDDKKRETADVIVQGLVDRFDFETVLDLGCGTMVYRKEFEKHANYLGVDGNPDAKPMLLMDISRPIDLYRQFDLVFCIEVAEHIEDEQMFLQNLTLHAKKWIVMTACPPKQGESEYRKVAHFNERPKEYWIKRLEDNGFEYKKEISEELQGYYRQFDVKGWFKNNLMVFRCAGS